MSEKEIIIKNTIDIVNKLNIISESPNGKEILAKLRDSLDNNEEKLINVLPLIFENIDEKLLGFGKGLNKFELSILTTLQLFAVYKQGNPNQIVENNKYSSFGKSLRNLRVGDDVTAIDRRFNTLITSTTLEEFNNHLRHMIKLLKAKAPQTKIDFGSLVRNIYDFINGFDKNVKIEWSRDYYRNINKEEKGDKENE